MRNLLVFALLLSVALLAGRLWQEPAPPVNAQELPAAGCGDLNADGNTDLTDAVHLLNWLFRGGPEPVCVESATGALPATGQTRCYDAGGNQIACDSGTCPGQDGFYQAGCSTEGRFVDNGDGTITDTCTGLMWQQHVTPFVWCEALAYCEGLELAGHSDWRLPNVRELQSIVDYQRSNPAIDPLFGPEAWRYWSSTSVVVNPHEAWYVNFDDGSVARIGKGFHGNVRAVRGGL